MSGDTAEAPREPSSDSIAAVRIQPLTDYEATEAAAVFARLLHHDDPHALTRTVEHVLRMRASAQPLAPRSEPSEIVDRLRAFCRAADPKGLLGSSDPNCICPQCDIDRLVRGER